MIIPDLEKNKLIVTLGDGDTGIGSSICERQNGKIYGDITFSQLIRPMKGELILAEHIIDTPIELLFKSVDEIDTLIKHLNRIKDKMIKNKRSDLNEQAEQKTDDRDRLR